MPYKNGQGPRGQGPQTGRRAGRCSARQGEEGENAFLHMDFRGGSLRRGFGGGQGYRMGQNHGSQGGCGRFQGQSVFFSRVEELSDRIACLEKALQPPIQKTEVSPS